MKIVTNCFCIQDDQILLGLKKRGFGEGKLNGFGGKQEPEDGEDILATALRELTQESGLEGTKEDLEKVAIVEFSFEGTPKFSCHTFLLRTWTGEPIETDEMRPEWFALSNLPYDQMWVADSKWLPLVLRGEKVKAKVNFSADGNTILSFEHEPLSL